MNSFKAFFKVFDHKFKSVFFVEYLSMTVFALLNLQFLEFLVNNVACLISFFSFNEAKVTAFT